MSAIQQVTDTKQLRKLLQKIREIPQVEEIIERVAMGSDALVRPIPDPIVLAIDEVLQVKKVKENQHMVAILKEIDAYLAPGNIEAAQKVAKRVLESPNVVLSLGKPNGK